MEQKGLVGEEGEGFSLFNQNENFNCFSRILRRFSTFLFIKTDNLKMLQNIKTYKLKLSRTKLSLLVVNWKLKSWG